MKTAILIPALNEAKNLPALFRALKALRKKSPEAEIHFIDNGSEDGTPALIREFVAKDGKSFLHREEERGFAEPLNRGLAAAGADLLLFLDADALPAPNWAQEMEKALASADLVVGETSSLLPNKTTPYGQLARLLFEKHSERSAKAHGHALPWGPTCNLGARAELFRRVGQFSHAATSAFDIDWCWRAVLAGAKLEFAPKAKVKHVRRNDREGLLRQFERYGAGEAWLHRAYAFLLDKEDRHPDPLLAAMDAFRRLRHHSLASKKKNLPLDEVAAAFASGVRLGYERPFHECSHKRALPREAIGWRSGKNEVTVYVPGKGVTQLTGKAVVIWENRKEPTEKLAPLFARTFRIPMQEAEHEMEAFLEAIRA